MRKVRGGGRTIGRRMRKVDESRNYRRRSLR